MSRPTRAQRQRAAAADNKRAAAKQHRTPPSLRRSGIKGKRGAS